MMIKHLRDFLRAYLKERAAAQGRVQKPKLLIYDEYLKKYVRAEELLLPGRKKIIEGPISLISSNEHVVFDILLKKFINPKLDLPAKIVPLGIKDEQEFYNLYDFNRTNQVNFNTSSIDYFWGKKKEAKNKKHSNYPALPPIHDKPEETGPFREGWAGQLTKPPISNPRPEKGSSSCFGDPDKDPKKKPKKKKPKKLVCGKKSKQEKDTSTTKEVKENPKCLELSEKDCKYFKDVKPGESTSDPQNDVKWSSRLDKEQSKKDSKNVFKNICSKLFLSGNYEKKTSKKEQSSMSHKSSSKLENDPSCKLKTDLDNELIKKVKDLNKTTESVSKIEDKKDNSTYISNSAQGKYNVCDLGIEPKKLAKSELVTPNSKCFPNLNTKPCPCTLTSSVMKTKPDPCGVISAKSKVENTIKYKQETPCSDSIYKKPRTDDTNLKPCSTSTSVSAQYKTSSDNTNMTTGKGSICSEFKKSFTAKIDAMEKECMRAQELKTYSIQRTSQCTALMVNKKDICDKEGATIKNTKYNFIVDPKVQKLKSPCSKNDDVSTEEIRNKECKISKEHKAISGALDVCEYKEKTINQEKSSKINDPCEICDKNICKNDTQSVKCPLSLSESINMQCPKSKKDENVTESASICTKLTKKDAELVLAECPKPKTKDFVSKKDDKVCKTSKRLQEKKVRNVKRQCKSLSAFQCQHIEPKVSEKLQIISQETSFNQVDMNSDLSKLKCEKYMGFKIKRSSSEVNQPEGNKKKSSKSPCKKLKSVEKPCPSSMQKSEVKLKEPKKSKSNEDYSKHKKIDTKRAKSEVCLKKSVKSSKTSLKKSKSSTNKKLNSKKSISCPNKIREDKNNEGSCQSETSELSKQSKRTEAKICSPSSKVDDKTKMKKVSSKQNIKKSKLVEDCCLTDISNIVESSKKCTNKDLKKFSDACEQDNTVEKMDKDLSNQCNKNVDDGDFSNKQEALREEQVDKPINTNGSKCSEMNKPEENKITCPPTKQQKSSGEQSQENTKGKILNKLKRNKSAVICSFDKASNKNKQISSKSKAAQNSKKILLKTKSSPNIAKTSTKGKKSKFCNKIKDPKTRKSEMSVRGPTVCSKPSKNLEITNKEKSSSPKTKVSKSKTREKSKDSKDNIAKSSSRSKSTRMCSLQTLQKRVTENAVKKSKTVEVKSFSEMKSSRPEKDKADLQSGTNASGKLSETKEKTFGIFQDRSKENIVVLFDKERKLDNCNVPSSNSGTTAVQYNPQNEYWYTNNTGSKFALKEDESQNECSKLQCSKLMQPQRHLTIPEHIIKQNTNKKDSSTVKHIQTIKNNLPKIPQKTTKGESVSVQNNNTKAKFTTKNEVNTMRKNNRDKWERLDGGKNIKSAESRKMGENFKYNNSVIEKYDIKDEHGNKTFILTNKGKRKDPIVKPILVKTQNVIEDQPLSENLKSAMRSEIKSKENGKHWITKNIIVGERDIIQKNKFNQEQMVLSNNIKRDIKTDLVEKNAHKHQSNDKKDELNIKELLNQQKLTKLKIFNPTISKRFALRSINGSHILPIAIKTERIRGESSYSSTEGNKHNSDALKKPITETINKPNTNKNNLNTNNKLNENIEIDTDLYAIKNMQPFNATNKLQPSLPSKSSTEHINVSLCNNNKSYARKNINSNNETQNQDKSITLNTSTTSISNEPKHKQINIKEKKKNVSEKTDSTKLSVLQNNENVHNTTKQSLNKSTSGNLKSDNSSSKLNILINNDNRPKDKEINIKEMKTYYKTEQMLMKLSRPQHKEAVISSVKQSSTKNETGHFKSDNSSLKLNISNIAISKDKCSKGKASNIKEMKRDFKAEKMHIEPSAPQFKEPVFNSTKQSLTKIATGNFKSDNHFLKLHKPVLTKMSSTDKKPSTANEIKHSPTTCVNLNKDTSTSTKKDVSSELSKTTTNNLQATVKREKIYTIQNINPKTAIQLQNKRRDLINANLKSPAELENLNTNKNVNIKSKTFIQETSSMLVNRKRPSTVNNTFAYAQNPSLVKSLSAKNNVEKQQIRVEVKNIQDKLPKSCAADTAKKLTNPGVKASLSHTKNDTIERQRTFLTKPGKRLKRILKKNPSLKVKRSKTYVVLHKSSITNSYKDNKPLVGSVQSKTQETGNVKQTNILKGNDIKKSVKVDRIRNRVSVIIKDHKINTDLSQRNVTNNINNDLVQDKTNENKIQIRLSKNLSKGRLHQSSPNKNLKSSVTSNINDSGKKGNTSDTNNNPVQMNKSKTVNVVPSSKLNPTDYNPFKKSPATK